VVVLDAGADSGDGGVKRKRVFVTSELYDGNLKAAGNSTTTGLAGADKLCQGRATAAGLGGNWIAWLSDSNTNAFDRIADVGPWYLLNGTLVFANKAALKGNPLTRINVDETRAVNNILFPWTGTNADGTKTTANCNNWTVNNASVAGEVGSTNSTTSAWTAAAAPACFIFYNLYCFEQ
jgi:hypothetical protein